MSILARAAEAHGSASAAARSEAGRTVTERIIGTRWDGRALVIRSVSRPIGSDQEPKAAARQNGERIAAGLVRVGREAFIIAQQSLRAPFPGRSAARSGALQTRDRYALSAWGDPGSAVHHFAPSALRAALHPGNAGFSAA